MCVYVCVRMCVRMCVHVCMCVWVGGGGGGTLIFTLSNKQLSHGKQKNTPTKHCDISEITDVP